MKGGITCSIPGALVSTVSDAGTYVSLSTVCFGAGQHRTSPLPAGANSSFTTVHTCEWDPGGEESMREQKEG